MKQLVMTFTIASALAGAALGAHGTNDHIRGTVTRIAGSSISVQTAEQPSKTVAIAILPRTVFEKSGQRGQLRDLKVGDRVVIDVHKGTLEAELIKFGAAPAPAQTKPPASRPKG